MKHSTFLVWGMFLPALASAAAGSGITSVTLFKDRASVRRQQKATLKPGGTTVTFEDVTPLADIPSLKAYLSEKQSVRLLGIRTEPRHRLRSENAELEKLKVEQQKLNDEVAEIQEKASVLHHQAENLGRTTQHYRDSFSFNLHANTWSRESFRGYLGLLEAQSSKMRGAWKKLFDQFEKAHHRLDMVAHRVGQLESVSDRGGLAVFVDVVADHAAAVDVTIQYLVTGTGWSPTYDLRISPRSGEATLEQHALIWQRTGEEWKDVALSLSNLPNELRTEPPSLSPYRLTYREAEKVKTTVASKQEDKTGLGDADGSGEQEGANGLAGTFEISGRQSVPKSGAQSKIFLSRKSSPYEEHLALVAAQYPRAFRRGTLKNPFPWRLASGAMMVFYDGDYLQTNRLEPVTKGGEIAINAGVEHNLRITRTTEDNNGTTGVIAKDNAYRRQVRVEVENFASAAKTLKVYEQVPVSEMAAVAVTWNASVQDGRRELASTQEPKNGWLNWDLAVAPRKKSLLKVDLEVTTPKDFHFQW